MAQFSNCLSIISRMSERDQDSLVARLDELQAQGVPAEKAQIQAAIDVLMRAQADAAGIQRSAARDVTETPEFKRWFADSKVVDAEGNPLVVYHGTSTDFDVFNVDSAMHLGAHFSADASVAKSFGATVVPAYLAIKRPVRLRDLKSWHPMAVASGLEKIGAITEKQRLEFVRSDPGRSDAAALLESLGYDGVVYLNRYEIAGSRKKTPAWSDDLSDDEFVARFPLAQLSYIALHPEQIKSATGNNGQFDPANPDITRSAARKTDTPEFKRWSGGAPLVRLGESHEYRSGQPVVVEALHGTTNSDLTAFKRERANIESDWGAGFYASNAPDDVATNYANNDGADLTQRIELLAERLASNEFDDDMDAARKEAKKRLTQESPNTMKLYVRMSNPAVQGGPGETFFDYNEEYNEETDEYGEPTGALVDFVDALRDAVNGFDESDADKAMAAVWDRVSDNGGIGLSDLVAALKSADGVAYATDDDGNIAASEIIRRALEGAGFDGIIDATVSSKFDSMKGMDADTVHFIAFEPTQLKSATGNNGAFDPNDANITRSVSRDTYAWRDSIDTSVGPLLQGEDFYLLPQREITQDDFGDNGFAANGLMGHAERAVPGTRTIAYRIVGDNGIIGTLVSDVDPSGVLRSVHDIEITDRRGGIGSKIVATIAANTQSPIKIQDITDEADPFWTRIGVGYKDQYGDAFLDWEDVAQYLGARRAAQVDPDAAASEGRDRGLQEGSYEVSELSPEEAADFFKFSKPRATETAAFKKWFGDSKVIDESGRPLVVYHGTVKDFDAFDQNAEPFSYESDRGKQFFLDNPRGASDYAIGTSDAYGGNANVMPVYLRMENPRIEEVDGSPSEWWDENGDGLYWELDVIGSGHDGLIVRGDDETMYVTSNPVQIKSAIGNNGDYSLTDPNITRSVARPAFYSQLQRAIEQVPDRLAAMAAPQWKLWLDANASKLGIKKDEIEWSGVKDYLTLRGKDKVTREDLVAYLADSGVRVQEVVLGNQSDRQKLSNEYDRAVAASDAAGGAMNPIYIESLAPGDRKPEEQALLDAWNRVNENPDESWLPEAGNPKYGQYTVQGGENYREVLITLPVKRELPVGYKVEPNPSKASNAKKFIVVDGVGERYGSGDTQQEALDRYFANHTPNAYRSSHWEQPNILAHLRVDDRVDADGNRVLFVNEIQSDWGQDGKKKGFNNDGLPPGHEVRKISVRNPLAGLGGNTAQAAERYAVFDSSGNKLTADFQTEGGALSSFLADSSKVPRAPFVQDTKAWASLALKRAIMMAVEDGHDKIAIITGEQAAGLYSLDKQISKVEYLPETNVLRAFDPNGRSVYDQETAKDKIEDVIGKDVAAKLLESEPYTSGSGKKVHRLEGIDLKVPATGMRKFYDELIPQVARDVLKKLGGGRLEEVGIPDSNAGREVVAAQVPGESMWGVYDRQKGQWLSSWESETYTSEPEDAELTSERTAKSMASAIMRDAGVMLQQTGFTITPAMREKVASGVPLFSKGRTSTGADWESPSASKFDDLVYKFQDKQIETKRVVEAIKEASGAISDDLNVYLNEELYHGRTAKRTEDFLNMELNPLIEEMAKANMKIADLEEFLHARHAKEANAVIAQRNPGEPGLQDGGSGMTNAEADNYMATLPAADRQKLEAAAAKVDAIIASTRKMFVDYELESQTTVDAWDGMFKHYVPLQREDKEGSPGLGQGFSIKGKETKGRTGSTRKVVDILANIAMQRERAIVRGEKNRVAQSLVGLVRANENPEFWLVDEVPTERVFNPTTGLVEDRVDPMYKSRDNAVVAKIKDPSGAVREHAVLFNEEDPRALRMAQALKNLDAQQLNGLLGVSAKITRYFAAVNTQYNPVFGVVNLVRDVQGAMLNLSSTPLKDDKVKIAKYTASALSGIYGDMRAARKGQNQTSAWAALWDEFQEVGGQTGYREMFATSADRAEAIQKALDPATWMDSKLGKVFTANGALKVPIAQAQKQAGFIFDWLSDYNNAMENGVRLAAYKAGLERGMTKQQAASAAKNLTTNFNRKGQAAQQAGAMYAFFNAAIQGTARIGRTLFDMEPGKPKTIRLSSAGKKIVYGGILLGAIQALALAAAGFNDDDPPEFARERSLIIPIGGKKYISIPMPLGFHVLPSIGRISTEFVLSGFKDPHKRALSLASLFAETFNPIGNAGLSMQTLAPTALDPLVALTENRDWTGRPIARESSNKAIPGHALGRDTATSVAKLLSEAINTLSGGNKYTSGVFSPTPDQIDYLIGQATGGVGRELSKVEQTVLSTARGESLPTYKVPLVGRFIGDAKSQASEGTAFYANTERLNRIETEMKGLQKDGKIAEATALRMSHSEAYLITMANQAERQIQKLRAEKRELVKANAPRDRVKAIEDRITAVMARLNRAMESLQDKQEN